MGSHTTDMYNLKEILGFSVTEVVESPYVSIIIPTYNNAKYLSKCLLSLINQTLKEIEIIIVNDGSTDETSSILSTFKEHDKRIKVLEQEHKLQGAARNLGMSIATGEYIGFVDSDDWVDLDYFEKLYKAAKKYSSDIALATNIRTGNGKDKKRLNIVEEKFVTSLQDKIDIGNQAKNPCPTNKIYKYQMLHNNKITWPEGVYCEDKLFTIQAVYYANGIVSVPNINYYYFRNPTSTVNNRKKHNLHSNILYKEIACKEVLKFLKEHNVQIRDCEFWAIKKDIKRFGLTWYQIKESFHTEKHLLFGFIPICEVYKNE